MLIKLSDSAANRINSFLMNHGGFGLRIGLRKSGCYGMTYILEFVDKPSEEDMIIEEKGIKIVINTNYISFLNGVKLDFVKEGLNEKFKFINPNVKNECGCGESFNI